MPLLHVALVAGKPKAYRQAIFDSLHQALCDTFDVPEEDQFMTITEHDKTNFRYGASYLDIARSDNLVFIQISAMNTRSVEQKKALFQRIVELLGERPGIRPEDVFINLLEGAKENWSLGHGLMQYA